MTNQDNHPQPTNVTTATPSRLADQVLGRIETEAITPRPRWQCLVFAYGSWTLWGLSVAVGALALAIVWYVLTSVPYMLYEATHTTAFTVLMDLIPLLWLFLLGLMLVLAVIELRRTKRGYRLTLVTIVGSSVALSVLGAIIFHSVGFSMWFDNALGHYVKGYMSFEKMEVKMWHAPDYGRYVGVIVVPATGLPPAFLPLPEFRDADGIVWRVITESLTPAERSVLFSAKPVQILGTSTVPDILHLCAVMPRLFAGTMSKEERLAHKTAFKERIETFWAPTSEQDRSYSATTVDTISATSSPCARLVLPRPKDTRAEN